MRRSLSAVVLLAFFPVMAHAQGRGGGGMARGAVAAPHFAGHASAPSMGGLGGHAMAVSRVPTGSRWVRTSSGALALRVPRRGASPVLRGGTINTRFLSQDVPGLGFDFPHVAAVRPGGRGFPGRFRNQRFVGAFFPFFGGAGYWPLFPEDVDEEPSADYQPAETAAAEPPPPVYPGYPYPPPPYARPDQQAPSSAPAAAPEPERTTDQYVFVRRDGTVFFAVGYMWENGTLRYVTSEGLRRSVAGSLLDMDATQQFNEQRGLVFRSPA
jgi:hypothetical protein